MSGTARRLTMIACLIAGVGCSGGGGSGVTGAAGSGGGLTGNGGSSGGGGSSTTGTGGTGTGSGSAADVARKLGRTPHFLVGMGNDLDNDHSKDGAYTLGVTLDLHYAYMVGLFAYGIGAEAACRRLGLRAA